MAEAFMMALRRGPTTSDLNPFGQAAALLAFDIDNVGVTAASASNSVLLDRVRCSPVLVFFNPLLLVVGGLFKVGLTW